MARSRLLFDGVADRQSVSARVFSMLAVVAVSCWATSWITSGRYREAGYVADIVVALALAWHIRRQLRLEMDDLSRVIQALPAFNVSNFEDFPYDWRGILNTLEGTSRDLQRAVGEAQEARLQLEALLDSMQDAVVAVDAAGRIQWTNETMQSLISGTSVSSVVRVGHALVQTIRDPEVLDCVRVAIDDGAVCERRTTTLLPGRIFEVNASPMPGGGAVTVLHDITRIEQVERAQRDFVANVSHELRTPLTSITGYVETLLDHEQGLTPTARDFLSTILKNATRMNRLTEDLLLMARVESQEAELHPAPVRADTLVHDAVAAMSGLVQDAEAVLEVGETTSTQIFADSDAVLQVLGNLIENGIKYGKARNQAQCRVVVSARDLPQPVDGGLASVEFSVRDFGQGIASEHLVRIFERFYRVDKARSHETGGTGLGLSIARHVVELQGGTIRAESELNAGSTFLVTLPCALYPV